MPLQVVVDDVGWWSGEDGSARGEPHRTGVARDHVPADYLALAELGRRLGTRPLAAFVAGEWDRGNLLRELPSSNPSGNRWDNRRWVGPWLDEAANVVRGNREHLEIAAHGLYHEYWSDGRMTRSEFHAEGGAMRSREDIVRHLDCFGRILDDNGLGPFPRAFVPPAHHHSFGNGEEGMQAILKQFGIRFVNTNFASCRRFVQTSGNFFVECGVMLVDRVGPFVPWNCFDAKPEFAFDQPVLALHWPNVLHANPSRNLEVVGRWVDFLEPYDHRLDGMLAADLGDCCTQLAYRSAARLEDRGSEIMIDVSRVREFESADIGTVFIVKIDAPEPLRWEVRGGCLHSARLDRSSGHHVLRLEANEISEPLHLTPGREP